MTRKPVPIPVPLLEREPKEIEEELARYFGIDRRDVRVTKHKLGDGRSVAYLRLVWSVGGLTPAEPVPRRKPGRPKKESPAQA